MDITRIQKILGHQRINTTMIYARVLDRTVEAEYHQAMSVVERGGQPLSNTPVLVTAWPAQTVFTENDQICEKLPIDNSV